MALLRRFLRSTEDFLLRGRRPLTMPAMLQMPCHGWQPLHPSPPAATPPSLATAACSPTGTVRRGLPHPVPVQDGRRPGAVDLILRCRAWRQVHGCAGAGPGGNGALSVIPACVFTWCRVALVLIPTIEAVYACLCRAPESSQACTAQRWGRGRTSGCGAAATRASPASPARRACWTLRTLMLWCSGGLQRECGGR